MDVSPYPSSDASSAALPPAAAVLMDTTQAARLWPGAGQAAPAEWLYADDGADLVAVHVGVADTQAVGDAPLHALDPAVDAERQAVAGGVDRVHQVIQPFGGVAHDTQNGAENLAPQLAGVLQQIGTRREEAAMLGAGWQRQR